MSAKPASKPKKAASQKCEKCGAEVVTWTGDRAGSEVTVAWCPNCTHSQVS